MGIRMSRRGNLLKKMNDRPNNRPVPRTGLRDERMLKHPIWFFCINLLLASFMMLSFLSLMFQHQAVYGNKKFF
jgi:hypothetical protein